VDLKIWRGEDATGMVLGVLSFLNLHFELKALRTFNGK
jgi:hypothetical protein